jgi:hypothetical protein
MYVRLIFENYRPALSSERTRHINKPRNCIKIVKERDGEHLVAVSDGWLTPGQTDRLHVGHNINLTLTLAEIKNIIFIF